MIIRVSLVVVGLVLMAAAARAQSNAPVEPPKKANARATTEAAPAGDPFDGASLEKLAGQCVTMETELGVIEIAMMPENAPEAVRIFLICRLQARLIPRYLVALSKGL